MIWRCATCAGNELNIQGSHTGIDEMRIYHKDGGLLEIIVTWHRETSLFEKYLTFRYSFYFFFRRYKKFWTLKFQLQRYFSFTKYEYILIVTKWICTYTLNTPFKIWIGVTGGIWPACHSWWQRCENSYDTVNI